MTKTFEAHLKAACRWCREHDDRKWNNIAGWGHAKSNCFCAVQESESEWIEAELLKARAAYLAAKPHLPLPLALRALSEDLLDISVRAAAEAPDWERIAGDVTGALLTILPHVRSIAVRDWATEEVDRALKAFDAARAKGRS